MITEPRAPRRRGRGARLRVPLSARKGGETQAAVPGGHVRPTVLSSADGRSSGRLEQRLSRHGALRQGARPSATKPCAQGPHAGALRAPLEGRAPALVFSSSISPRPTARSHSTRKHHERKDRALHTRSNAAAPRERAGVRPAHVRSGVMITACTYVVGALYSAVLPLPYSRSQAHLMPAAARGRHVCRGGRSGAKDASEPRVSPQAARLGPLPRISCSAFPRSAAADAISFKS